MTVFLDCGGPIHEIQVEGKRYRFEMHPWCGPIAVNRQDEELTRQPMPFLKAASLWAQQGRRIEDGLCVWYHEPKPILQHLGGRHYKLLGEYPAERGS